MPSATRPSTSSSHNMSRLQQAEAGSGCAESFGDIPEDSFLPSSSEFEDLCNTWEILDCKFSKEKSSSSSRTDLNANDNIANNVDDKVIHRFNHPSQAINVSLVQSCPSVCQPPVCHKVSNSSLSSPKTKLVHNWISSNIKVNDVYPNDSEGFCNFNIENGEVKNNINSSEIAYCNGMVGNMTCNFTIPKPTCKKKDCASCDDLFNEEDAESDIRRLDPDQSSVINGVQPSFKKFMENHGDVASDVAISTSSKFFKRKKLLGCFDCEDSNVESDYARSISDSSAVNYASSSPSCEPKSTTSKSSYPNEEKSPLLCYGDVHQSESTESCDLLSSVDAVGDNACNYFGDIVLEGNSSINSDVFNCLRSEGRDTGPTSDSDYQATNIHQTNPVLSQEIRLPTFHLIQNETTLLPDDESDPTSTPDCSSTTGESCNDSVSHSGGLASNISHDATVLRELSETQTSKTQICEPFPSSSAVNDNMNLLHTDNGILNLNAGADQQEDSESPPKPMQASTQNTDTSQAAVIPPTAFNRNPLCSITVKEATNGAKSKDTDTKRLSFLHRSYRVHIAGGLPLATEDIAINKYVMANILHESVMQVLNESDSVSLASPLQAYMWPAVAAGQNVVAVGERSNGKTLGYVVPLASLLLELWPCIESEASVRVGGVAIVVCKGWRAVQCVGNTFSQLLHPHHLRVVATWGGMGQDSIAEIQKQVYKGLDVLVTTLPFLLKLIGTEGEAGDDGVKVDILSHSFHLVLDDVDVILDNNPEGVKTLLKQWFVYRAKSEMTHFCQQLIVTSSSWTRYVRDLTEYLFTLIEPMLMISSPLQAARACNLQSTLHISDCHNSEFELLQDASKIVHEKARFFNIIVFVRSYQQTRQMQKLLDSSAVYSTALHGRLLAWELQERLKHWSASKDGKVMIASHRIIPYLLKQDLRDAHMIVHVHIPKMREEFVKRLSFLMDHYTTTFNDNITAKSSSSVLMVDQNRETLPPYLMECLNDLRCDIPLLLREKFTIDVKTDVPLCHYLKAFGSCPYMNLCTWRHEVIEEDLECKLPDKGIVSLEVVKVLNASRYLVRLKDYRETTSSSPVDLSSSHFTLFMTLQNFCSSSERLSTLKGRVRVGSLCLVHHESVWARARVLRVHFSDIPKVTIFLMDEGSEIVVPISELYQLPSEFSQLPQLILEVYLCKVRPLDFDTDWTHGANHFIEKLFNSAPSSTQLIGSIATSLSHTLWLSPLVHINKVGNSLIRNESIRSQLIRQEYGSANDNHLTLLEQQLELLKARQKCEVFPWLSYWIAEDDLDEEPDSVSSEN